MALAHNISPIHATVLGVDNILSFKKMSFGKKLFLQILWWFSLIGLSSQRRSHYSFVVSPIITSYLVS